MAQDDIHVTEDEQSPRSCVYCHNLIETGQAAVVCRECGVAHHSKCWETNESCAALNCDCQEYADLHIPTPARVDSIQIIADEHMLSEVSILEPDFSVTEQELPAPEPVLYISNNDLTRANIVLADSDLPPPLIPYSSPEMPEASCTLCHNPIEASQQTVACHKCKAPYHGQCWNHLDHCATLGCRSKQSTPYALGQQTDQGLAITRDTNKQKETIKDKLLRFLQNLKK